MEHIKEHEELAYINRHKRRAKDFPPDVMVIPAYRARAAVERAYVKGYRNAIS